MMCWKVIFLFRISLIFMAYMSFLPTSNLLGIPIKCFKIQQSCKLQHENSKKKTSLVITIGYNYGRGFHLFISEITFAQINSKTDGSTRWQYFRATIFQANKKQDCAYFSIEKHTVLQSKSFQNM